MKSLFLFVVALFSFVSAHAQTPTLTLNQQISQKCELGDKFSYEIKANSGDFIHLIIRQNAINVTTSLFSPDGKQLIKSESPFSVYETEWLSWKFDTTGTYRIEMEGKRSAGNGFFVLELVEQRKYVEADQKRLIAQENFLLGAVSLESFDYPKAIESTKTALKQYQELGRDGEIALCYSNLGKNDYQNGNNSQSIQYFEKAIEFYKKANDLSSESLLTFLIGNLHFSNGNFEKSLEFRQKALDINKQIGDKNRIAFSTLEIGRFYELTSKIDKAIEFYEDTLKQFKEIQNLQGEGETINQLADIYTKIGRLDKAVTNYLRAVEIARKIKFISGEVITLLSLGNTYNSLGSFAKALSVFQESLTIAEKHNLGAYIPSIYASIAHTYVMLGNYQKAKEMNIEGLKNAREHNDFPGEGANLYSLGNVNNILGNFEDAKNNFEQAIEIHQKTADKYSVINVTLGLSECYRRMNKFDDANKLDEKVLETSIEIGDRYSEGVALMNLGLNSLISGENDFAISRFEDSLKISREIETKDFEASVLTNLMRAFIEKKQTKLAVFYGKQLINVRQIIRGRILSLDESLRQKYLQSHEETYRELVSLLIEENRLPEAEQVLALLKNDEFAKLANRGQSVPYGINYTKPESKAVSIYENLTKLGKEQIELNDLQKTKKIDEKGKVRLVDLEKEKLLETGLLKQSLSEISNDKNAVKDFIEQKETLTFDDKNLPTNTAALYTMVGNKQGFVVLLTKNSREVFPIDTKDLSNTVLQMREVLRTPASNPLPTSQKLYTMIFGQKNEKGITLAERISQLSIKTLRWSLDGVLRYVPINALHNGKLFLVEKYSSSIFTTFESKTKTAQRAKPNQQIVGFGVTRKFENFPALKNVAEELSVIIKDSEVKSKGLLSGKLRLDEKFTEKQFLEDVQKGFPIVHIASHFSFQPADELSSFLLLGNGNHLTLDKLLENPNLFANVELVTLNACDTATIGSNGKNIEGFAYLAQTLGAKNVIASLLPIEDLGASKFMQEFYRLKKLQPKSSIDGNFRQAALKILKTKVGDHPYFWANYVLIKKM